MNRVIFSPVVADPQVPTIVILPNKKDISFQLLRGGEIVIETYHASFADGLRQAASTMDRCPGVAWRVAA